MSEPRTNSFAPGDIVAGLEPSDIVEIQRIAPFGGKILFEGVAVQSRRLIKRPLTSEEADRLQKVRGSKSTYDGDAKVFLLGAEAERIRIAHQFDPLHSIPAKRGCGLFRRLSQNPRRSQLVGGAKRLWWAKAVR